MLAGISDNIIILIVWCDILRISLCWTVCLFVNRCTLFLNKLLHACFQIKFLQKLFHKLELTQVLDLAGL